jgi:hypothetical protein
MESVLAALVAEPPAVHVNAATTATQRDLPSPLPLAGRPAQGLSLILAIEQILEASLYTCWQAKLL